MSKADFIYRDKAQTGICYEHPDSENPYLASRTFLYGYDILELIRHKRFSEVLLLLFKGELPPPGQSEMLERLMVALINPGPRHPAVRAAMVAGVSKTNAEHLLPIGLSVLGGKQNGAAEVADAVRFLNQHIDTPPQQVAQRLLQSLPDISAGESLLCPGFGCIAGDPDPVAAQMAELIFTDEENKPCPFYQWACAFNHCLKDYNLGWLRTGVAAVTFCELGIAAREAIGLFQLLCAPGIFAHGAEQTHLPITAMPMPDDDAVFYPANKEKDE